MRDSANPPRPDAMSATAEFRATPDIAKNTGQFRAFAASHDSAHEQPWAMRAPARSILRLAAIVIAVAAVLVLAAILVLMH